ncbi:MAG: Rpn family recombination-promoting nuclease/putative transposase [Lachnospiraceae bacterium]|nr:Rpn family recombination-promoting nuclease/putative transposase [Lachnospiraceae bacterium]
MNQKKFEELELQDDFMFGKVMKNKEICKRTLEILLGIEIEDIDYPETQKEINITYQGKSVRLDVYVADDRNNVYNAEMQQKDDRVSVEQLPKRSRYYQGMLDLNLIEKGLSYAALNTSYVIFICTFDPFGKGMYQYTFQHQCKEDRRLALEDGTAVLFFNTKGNMENAPEELRTFLRYIETKQPESAFTRVLDREVRLTKSNEKWRREYMKELLLEFDLKEEGKREGRQEGKREALCQSTLDILSDLGPIPKELKTKIENTQDISVLQSWVKLAARSVDLEEFKEKMDSCTLQ